MFVPFDRIVVLFSFTTILSDTADTLSNILNVIFSFVTIFTALFVGDKFVKYGGNGSIGNVVLEATVE